MPLSKSKKLCAGMRAYKRQNHKRFVEEAQKDGWSTYADSVLKGKPGYLGSLQKRVKQSEDTLFFINLNLWDMNAVSRGAIKQTLVASSSVQFNLKDEQAGDAVEVTAPFISFNETEEFYRKMWSCMNFGRDEIV